MKNKSGISKILARMTILPLLLLGFICSAVGSLCVSNALADEVRNELETLADIAASDLDAMYPGEYSLYTSDEEMLFTKGDTILNGNHDYLDSRKKLTNVDYSLIYGDVRVITTLRDNSDERLVGTYINPTIKEEVISKESNAFFRNVDIFGNRYYCFYKPIYNSDDSCVGMLAAVMPTRRVTQKIMRAIIPFIAITILSVILSYFWSLTHARQLTNVTQQLSSNFDKIAGGSLSNTVSPELLSRKDEFGDMAHSIVDMQASLRSLVEQDALTKLYNRRFGQKRLITAFDRMKDSKSPLSVALGDIDFFKKFNDTYGHDCGDVILSSIAQFLQSFVKDCGFCCRWGGEEFLIVLTVKSYEEHHQVMEDLVRAIADNRITYEDMELSVTMTFGLVDATTCDNVETILRRIDELLYTGKEGGRNRLVVEEPNEKGSLF